MEKEDTEYIKKIRDEIERIMSSFSNINKILYYWIERLEKEELNTDAKGETDANSL